jgi:enoyl-CoA hydratase/carnithine racemase
VSTSGEAPNLKKPAGGAGDSSSGTIETTIDGHVALVLLRRPPHNLLTVPLLRSLADHVESLEGRCRAAVIASVGRSFCAGADFRSDSAPDPTAGNSFAATTGSFYAQALRLFNSPVPTVAAIQGAAIGAGFGLALACDLRIAGQGAWFQVNFVRLGIHPGFALSATLPRLVGPGRATELLLTARRVDSDEAGRIGLCEQVVPAGGEVDAALAVASEIAAGAPGAVASTRATLRAGISEMARDAMAHELDEQASLAGTPDAREGVLAMLERRSPVFGGGS